MEKDRKFIFELMTTLRSFSFLRLEQDARFRTRAQSYLVFSFQ